MSFKVLFNLKLLALFYIYNNFKLLTKISNEIVIWITLLCKIYVCIMFYHILYDALKHLR